MDRRHATVLLLLSAACADVRAESTAATREPLVGGARDTGDAAVVLFQATGDQGGECTAVFASTTVLLTAAHCVLDENSKPLVGSTFRIYRGDDFSKAKETDWITIDPSDVHPHPAYTGDAHDMAVLVLRAPVSVTPLPLATALARADVGQPVRLVGYGANVAGASADNDGFGLKRDLDVTLDGLETDFIRVGRKDHTACGGDSGGPALMKIGGVDTIVGLDSYSDAKIDCTGAEHYQRVDTEAKFLATYLPPAPPPTQPPSDPPPSSSPLPPNATTEKDPPRHDDGPAASAEHTGGCAVGRSRSAPSPATMVIVLASIVVARARAKRSRSST